MLRTTRCALLLSFALGLAQKAGAQPEPMPYHNPVIGDPRRVEQAVADPFVLKWNGEYYLYATGEPIRAWHSRDLVTWKPLGGVLSPSKDAKAWNQAEVWAPEVVYRQGKFYLYYTATRKSADWKVSEAERRVGVAVADTPAGPFVDSGKPVSKGWAIDGTVFRDPDGGQEYLFYSYLLEPKLPGAGIVFDRLVDWSTAAGKPTLVTRGSEAWEDKDGDPRNGSVRYTNEAPVVVKRLGRYLMMYSGGSWDLPTYAVAYATSPRLAQGGLTGPGWQKVTPPFLRGTRFVEGPGHHALVKAPNNVDDICVHHARVVPFADAGDRLPFVARLYWNHDRPFMPSPTTAEQAVPDRPLFQELFDRAAGPLGGPWKLEGGSWSIADGQVKQTKAEGVARAVAKVAPLWSYVLEANLRFGNTGADGGAIGVTAFDAGPDNRVDVWLDAKKRTLVSSGKVAGKVIPEVATKLPSSFAPEAYHQLLVTKNAGRLTFTLDGVSLQARRLVLGAGSLALQTRDARAWFDGVAVTQAFEDDFQPGREACTTLECLGWESSAGSWKLAGGRLQQTNLDEARAVALKGEPVQSYELTATLRFGKGNADWSRAGVVAAANDKGELVLVGFDRASWPSGKLHLQHVAGGKGKVKQSLAVTLPRGFDYNEPHTLRVVKQEEGLSIFLDGKEMAGARVAIGASRPGLFTSGTDASFLGVAWKPLVVPQNRALNPSFETEQWNGPKATRDNPWILEGTARVSECCAHSGLRRLLFQGGWGGARQRVTGLPAGRYTIWAWVQAAGGAEAELRAQVSGSSVVSSRSRVGSWNRLSLAVHVPKGGVLDISFLGKVEKNTLGSVSLDDVYLFRY